MSSHSPPLRCLHHLHPDVLGKVVSHLAGSIRSTEYRLRQGKTEGTTSIRCGPRSHSEASTAWLLPSASLPWAACAISCRSNVKRKGALEAAAAATTCSSFSVTISLVAPSRLGAGHAPDVHPGVGQQPAAPAKVTQVRLPPELAQALEERAARDRTPPSEVIRRALREYLKV